MMIESQEILNMLYNKLPKDEQEMMNNYLYCEFGCEVIFKNTDHNNKDDLQPIKVKGYQIKLAVAHLYNHPLLKIDKLMNGIYPEYWLEIEDLEKEQYKAKIKKLDPKKNKKVYDMVVNTFTKMVDKTKFPNFSISEIRI